ncbi:hypothetical protein Nmel_006079, partial [Mimus melanotis]
MKSLLLHCHFTAQVWEECTSYVAKEEIPAYNHANNCAYTQGSGFNPIFISVLFFGRRFKFQDQICPKQYVKCANSTRLLICA